jgi:hypothetical protein
MRVQEYGRFPTWQQTDIFGTLNWSHFSNRILMLCDNGGEAAAAVLIPRAYSKETYKANNGGEAAAGAEDEDNLFR